MTDFRSEGDEALNLVLEYGGALVIKTEDVEVLIIQITIRSTYTVSSRNPNN